MYKYKQTNAKETQRSYTLANKYIHICIQKHTFIYISNSLQIIELTDTYANVYTHSPQLGTYSQFPHVH